MDSKQNILIKFGERVREIRKEKGLSQEELAHKADLHRTYIGMIERAEKNITILNIEKIANALEVSIKDLFNELQNKQNFQ
ncbi:MAG: helix-turn-helix transcriptional regulator [Urechidicola sp.]|nr:helix-turn-helix transcriptional regulator [Urechidicola sp.]